MLHFKAGAVPMAEYAVDERISGPVGLCQEDTSDLNLPGNDLAGVRYLRWALVIGAGFIGMEVASVLAQKGVSTTMLLGEDRIWKRFSRPRCLDSSRAIKEREASNSGSGRGLRNCMARRSFGGQTQTGETPAHDSIVLKKAPKRLAVRKWGSGLLA
jgi:hypothetical protein